MNETELQTQPIENIVILAVDDDESNLLLLKRPLLKEGYSLITAQSGREALEILRSTRVDIVLMDWMMPEMPGPEVCRRIKADPALTLIPVIMVTAKTGVNDLTEGLAAGAIDYVKKPIDRMELIARVKAGLREYKVQRQLDAANRRLRELDAIKDELLAVVSHDLRSPLNAIIGFANILKGGRVGELLPPQKRPVEIIINSGEKLLKLINNLLDLAKLESGSAKLDRAPCRIGEIARECCESVAVNAELKNISLAFEKSGDDPALFIDEIKINQVVNNLLSNAIKFTPAGGAVTARSYAENDAITISVQDTGPGIPEDELKTLFTKFHQLSTKSTAGEKGTGLGLVIAKNVVELHGGKLWLESKVGEGSCFYVSIPVAANAMPERKTR